MNGTGLITSPIYLKHFTGKSHPESSDRLKFITKRLNSSKIWKNIKEINSRPATFDELVTVHSESYLKEIEMKCKTGNFSLEDRDTVICKDSYTVASHAAGGVIKAVEMIFEQKINNAFCAVRPPGHHAEIDSAMGFCIFNNVAIAAKAAQRKFDVERIFILDWDVHHGNGIQHIFEYDPTVYYVSLHQYPFYPGTGGRDEKGKGDGLGTTKNFPLSAGSGDQVYLDILSYVIPDIVTSFNPDLIILSAGFDAHKHDPLGNMDVSTECFAKMTEIIVDLAIDTCKGKLLSILEGGYNLSSLAESVDAHLMKLMEITNERLPEEIYSNYP